MNLICSVFIVRVCSHIRLLFPSILQHRAIRIRDKIQLFLRYYNVYLHCCVVLYIIRYVYIIVFNLGVDLIYTLINFRKVQILLTTEQIAPIIFLNDHTYFLPLLQLVFVSGYKTETCRPYKFCHLQHFIHISIYTGRGHIYVHKIQ